jgi:hypothetical protein
VALNWLQDIIKGGRQIEMEKKFITSPLHRQKELFMDEK